MVKRLNQWRELENTEERAVRLKREGRWVAFKAARQVLYKEGKSGGDCDIALFSLFGPGTNEASADAQDFDLERKVAVVLKAAAEETVEGAETVVRESMEVLPSGIPLEDAAYWKGRKNPKTTQLANVQWVEEHKMLKGITRDDCPSLTCWAHYMRTVMTIQGEMLHDKLVHDLMMPSKRDLDKQRGKEIDVKLEAVFDKYVDQIVEKAALRLAELQGATS